MRPDLEERYVVIKLKDLSSEQKANLKLFLNLEMILTTDCVVVEQDWPIYNMVCDMVLGLINIEGDSKP